MPDISELYDIYLNSSSVTIDSRSVSPGAIFFGLKGEQFDGNKFAGQALDSGAAFAIVDNPDYCQGNKFILVRNSIETLQQLASFHRKKMDVIVIAITGSNGKTTTKELTGSVLAASYSTVVTPGNLNNHIGVPLTLLTIHQKTRFAVVEMGANHLGEIASLCEIACPDYGLITNIGKAHLEGFGGFEGVIRAKSELYQYIKKINGTVFYNSDDKLLSQLSLGINRISYGTGDQANCRCKLVSSTTGLKVSWNHSENTGEVATHLPGDYNFENIMAAICVASSFKVPSADINKAIGSYIPANNRSQLIDTGRNKLILDAYNANPSSMKAALENFYRMPGKHKLVILGDMMELGDYSPAEHSAILSLLDKLQFDHMILVGGNFLMAAQGSMATCFPSTSEATDWLAKNPPLGQTILLKGSRKMELEKLLKYL
jgi:UDP-N-acetylmuramoyl-tripeptide--D-alanyl-D-alanine ligase